MSDRRTEPASDRVRLVPYRAEHVDLLVPWFEDAETRRFLGGPRWPQMVHDLLTGATPQSAEFRGSVALRSFGFVGLVDDVPVSYAGGDVYDRGHVVTGRGVDGSVTFASAPGPPRMTAGVDLVVAPSHRARGLGAATLTATITDPSLADVHVWTAGIEPDNVASRRAFAAAGFVLVDPAPDAEGMLTYRLDTQVS